MKRKPTPTKRERKAAEPPRPAPSPRVGQPAKDETRHAHGHAAQHIHCIACGRHLEPTQFEETPPTAVVIACEHGSRFATCTDCLEASRALLEEHDKSGQPVRAASAWH